MLDPELIAELIREVAAAEILPRFGTLAAAEIHEKAPGQLVTSADIAAEKRLTARLKEHGQGLVIGEEACADDPGLLDHLGGGTPVWVIDPIDGTRNFAAGRPGFGVILALIEGGMTRAGFLYDPLSDVLISALAGGGAWLNGQRLRLDRERPLSGTIGSAYGPAPSGQRAATLLTASGRIAGLRNHGCSALEYIDIARGASHFSLHSRSLAWDHAAGLLATIEAGGVAGFLDGGAYDPKIGDRPVLAAASPAIATLIKEILGGARI
ncbi:MAG TPA: inositol monophosphatase [Stellaceae bacterium]|nr:inositol monophosphatase [Stellaceae bacterium]